MVKFYSPEKELKGGGRHSSYLGRTREQHRALPWDPPGLPPGRHGTRGVAACGTFRLTWEEEGRLDNVNPLTQEILERLEASRGRGTGGSRHSVLINFVCRLDGAQGCPESWQALFLGCLWGNEHSSQWPERRRSPHWCGDTCPPLPSCRLSCCLSECPVLRLLDRAQISLTALAPDSQAFGLALNYPWGSPGSPAGRRQAGHGRSWSP